MKQDLSNNMLGIQPISTIHSIVNQVMSEALARTTTFEIKRAKLNYKYRNEKRGGNRPRQINKTDLRALHHMLAELPIRVLKDRKTNDIKFIVNHDEPSNTKINKSIELMDMILVVKPSAPLGLTINAAMKPPKYTLELPPPYMQQCR